LGSLSSISATSRRKSSMVKVSRASTIRFFRAWISIRESGSCGIAQSPRIRREQTRSQSTINAGGRSMMVTIIVVPSGIGQYLFSAFLVQSFRLSNVSALQTLECFLFQLLAEAIDHDHGHLADRAGRIWNVGHLPGHSRCSLHASSSKVAKHSRIMFVPNLK
jgi:hypothetical protein